MLYPLTHRMTIPNCRAFNEEIFQFCGIKRPLTNYGGEFIAGDYELLCDFMTECDRIYNEMVEKKYRTNRGDEFIVRIAADKMRNNVKTAGGYVFRFWTGLFYLVSTCYKYDAISVLHMPDEKQRGIIKIFEYLCKHNTLPSKNKVYYLCRLKSMPLKQKVRTFLNDLKNK